MEPNQTNRFFFNSILVPNSFAYFVRTALAIPSEAIIISESANCDISATFCSKCKFTPSSKHRWCNNFNKVLREQPQKPFPAIVTVSPSRAIIISSQYAKLLRISSYDCISRFRNSPNVSSEKTTPKPKLSSGLLRSYTSI